MGHNLVAEYALEAGATHTLLLASDTQAPDDVLPWLLELDRAATALHIPTYWVDGPRSNEFATWDARTHMDPCACMLLRRYSRYIFSGTKWRVDIDRGLTDDPAMYADLTELRGEQLYVRHDVLATHWPASIPPIGHRHSEEQRRVHR
jgi:hypothetical protein